MSGWKELPRPATPGRWRVGAPADDDCDVISFGCESHYIGDVTTGGQDAAAIAALPDYVAEVARLRAWVDVWVGSWPKNGATEAAAATIRAGEWPEGRRP